MRGKTELPSRLTDLPLGISALGFRADRRMSPPAKDFLDRVRALALERTGVACEWPVPPNDWTLDRLISHASSSGTMPHVLAAGPLFEEPTNRKVLLGNAVAHEMSADLLQRHMPRYCARLRQYGRSVEEVLREHLHEGRNLYVPVGFAFGGFPALIDHPGARFASTFYYSISFRDDILRKVFPAARTEAELRDLFIRKGSLDVHDLTDDIPLASLADLRRYLEAVKSLGFSASLAATPDPFSIYWSLCTAAGYFWNYPILLGDPPDWNSTTHFYATGEGKEYLRWWNGVYRDGLVDPEMFDVTTAELEARQREGRYALINDWYWSAEAREAARSRGYGYRSFPLFFGRWKPFWNNYAHAVERTEHPLVFTRRIGNGGELARVMRWADWHLSEERDVLASWGLPEWYTGTGRDRRYTWEHHALEDWSVYGIGSDDDGETIGLEHTPAFRWNPVAAPRLPSWPLSFFDPAVAYPEAPFWVCPWEPRKLLKVTSLQGYAAQVIGDAHFAQHRLVYRGTRPSSLLERLPEAVAYTEACDTHGERLRSVLREALTCGAGRFERAHADYLKLLNEMGLETCRLAAIAYLRETWRTDIEPNIVRDRR